MDGKAQPFFEDVRDAMVSADGRHFAYLAGGNGKFSIVNDGNELPAVREKPEWFALGAAGGIFTSDSVRIDLDSSGRRTASKTTQRILRNGEPALVVPGQVSWLGIETLTSEDFRFSPSGARVAALVTSKYDQKLDRSRRNWLLAETGAVDLPGNDSTGGIFADKLVFAVAWESEDRLRAVAWSKEDKFSILTITIEKGEPQARQPVPADAARDTQPATNEKTSTVNAPPPLGPRAAAPAAQMPVAISGFGANGGKLEPATLKRLAGTYMLSGNDATGGALKYTLTLNEDGSAKLDAADALGIDALAVTGFDMGMVMSLNMTGEGKGGNLHLMLMIQQGKPENAMLTIVETKSGSPMPRFYDLAVERK